MLKPLGVCCFLVCVCLAAQPQQKEVTSTPEERARFVAITHKLEQAPLDESLYSDREWALKWTRDITDIHISICPAALGDLWPRGGGNSHYKYAPLITVQFLLSTGAYIIEHPGADIEVAQAPGLRGALKAYDAILKADPKARSKALEELRKKEVSGQLEDYVRQQCASNSK